MGKSKKRYYNMKKTLPGYRAVIFDMDGTLYYQPPLRLRMAGKLAAYFLRHPSRYGELLAVKTFRKIREHWTETSPKQNGNDPLDRRQYEATAKKMGVSAEWVQKTVEYWMYQVPLNLLPGCLDRLLTHLIEKLRKRGIQVFVYSDYPAEEKLRALGIPADHIFSALDPEIMCLKPDPKGLNHILSVTGFSPDQVLMVGDRDEKDGMAARNAGIDWLILPSAPKKRKKLLKEIIHED